MSFDPTRLLPPSKRTTCTPPLNFYSPELYNKSTELIIRYVYADGYRVLVTHKRRRRLLHPSKIFMHELRKYSAANNLKRCKDFNGVRCLVRWDIRGVSYPNFWLMKPNPKQPKT